jgi:hypothetical protein
MYSCSEQKQQQCGSFFDGCCMIPIKIVRTIGLWIKKGKAIQGTCVRLFECGVLRRRHVHHENEKMICILVPPG